jgi:hypothetical protein
MVLTVVVLLVMVELSEVVETVVVPVVTVVVVTVVVDTVDDSVVVSVVVELSWQKTHVLSHRCMWVHVGQKTVSQSCCTQSQHGRQSSSVWHVVLDSVVVKLAVTVVKLHEVRVMVVLVSVPLEIVVVVEPVETVIVESDVVVEVTVVVCVFVVELSVVVVSLVTDDDVRVKVVQSPHVMSHMPANSPHVGQKRVAQGSSQGFSKFMHVRLQNQSGFILIIWQLVSEEVEIVVVPEVTVVVEAVVVETVEVVRVVVSLVPVLLTVDWLVSVVVSVLVVPLAQMAHVRSHMWAAGHVGQKTVSQEQSVLVPLMQFNEPLIINSHVSTQSS